jgi:heparanase 1
MPIRSAVPAGLVLLAVSACHTPRDPMSVARPSAALDPTRMARIGKVSERYQSYNVEMREVTGGKFWRPYGPEADAGLYQFRPPIDLSNPRLRKLAAALGPAYVRVSGTWANSTYFPDSDEAPASPPPGFIGVLSRQRWRAVVDFAKAVDAEIVTSFAINAGTRDGAGAWAPEQAARVVAYTKSVGGRIAAAEFMNEPNLAAHGGAPSGYDAAAYGRDFKAFRAFAKQAAPDMLILGPGSSGETAADTTPAKPGMLKSVDMLGAAGPGLDVFSYHHYGALSQRCAAIGKQTSVDEALTEEWLASTDAALASYRTIRDRFEPGKPIWNTETADAACGGNRWAGTFLDTFRYLDQLGRLAKQGVSVVIHNTLVASDYGMVDDQTLAPKPKYWGALLWRKLMGTAVLDSCVPIREGLHVYAHCLRGVAGGVALLAINNAKTAAQTIALPLTSERYTLSASDLQSRTVNLNGKEVALVANDDLPSLTGVATPAGAVVLAPASITLLAVPAASNAACR